MRLECTCNVESEVEVGRKDVTVNSSSVLAIQILIKQSIAMFSSFSRDSGPVTIMAL